MLHTLKELTENFSLFDDWEGRYQYLIDLGSKLPLMDNALKTDATFVPGCQSMVWLFSQKDGEGRYHFLADSNGDITKGLIYILLSAYEGLSATEIAKVDIDTEFNKMGLAEHLSPNRRNGFYAMVEKIRGLSV